ncbi:MAG: hypothetical protein VKK04_14520 [Synechococcales bacterium]|nr:hypothetical protein [Synechococcales bacterium]
MNRLQMQYTTELSLMDNTPSSLSLSWYTTPDDIKVLLVEAAAHWEVPEVADVYLHRAIACADGQLDVLVSAYRYFFYQNRNGMALEIANRILQEIRAAEQLPTDWGRLREVIEGRKDDPNIRLYLNAYAASGFVLARLRHIDQAIAVLSRVCEVDRHNEFGARSVLNVLTQPATDDEDD